MNYCVETALSRLADAEKILNAAIQSLNEDLHESHTIEIKEIRQAAEHAREAFYLLIRKSVTWRS
mgnify:CR=1 FL=1